MNANNYISILSNSRNNEDGTKVELLRVFPVELIRRFESVHTSWASSNQWNLQYAHTDTLVSLRTVDRPKVFMDVWDMIIENPEDVTFLAMPANVSIKWDDDGETQERNMKRMVCFCFPEIAVSNRYENRRILIRNPRYRSPEVPVVDAEEVSAREEQTHHGLNRIRETLSREFY